MSEIQLPDTWIWKKLSGITEIVGGSTPSRDNTAYFQGNIPWATPTDITKLNSLWINKTSETLTQKGLDNSSANLLPRGTVLMTSRASIGDTAINTIPMATNQGFANFICNEDFILNEYLAYWLSSIKQKLIQLAGGTTFKEISKSTLSRVEIPLPPLPEQRRIAAILREVDEIRKLRQEANKKTQKIVEALFYEMFGDPIKSKMSWNRKKLSDFVDINSSLVQPTQEKYKGVWHVGSDNIESGTGRILDLHTIAEVGAISSKFLFTEEHILYSKIRPSLKKVATPDFTGLCSADIYPISFDAKQISKIFLAQLLRSNSFTDYTVRVSGRAQIPKINREDLLKYETILPNYESQRDFEERVLKLSSAQKLNERFTSASNVLYQSLLSQAFTGELTAAWREQNMEELTQSARERNALLQRSTMVSTEPEIPTFVLLPDVEIEREDLVDQLSTLQQALLNIFLGNLQSYFTANQLYEDYEEDLQTRKLQASLDQVRRELRTLAALGLIREITLPVTDQPGRLDYATVYRYPQPDDDTMSEDLELLATRNL